MLAAQVGSDARQFDFAAVCACAANQGRDCTGAEVDAQAGGVHGFNFGDFADFGFVHGFTFD
jgi:hypothetical protein